MPQDLTNNRLANRGAKTIREAFESYRTQFDAVTSRAISRFKTLDWQGMRADAAARLDIYKNEVDIIETAIRHLLGDRIEDKQVWANLRSAFAGLVNQRNDRELAETFFNSVTRRIFATVGVDSQIEFVDTESGTSPTPAKSETYRSYKGGRSAAGLIRKILSAYPLAAEFQNLKLYAGRVAEKIEVHLHKKSLPAAIAVNMSISAA